MALKFGGYGLAAILGVGAIILAIMNNSAWQWFLGAAFVLAFFSAFMKHNRRKHHRR